MISSAGQEPSPRKDSEPGQPFATAALALLACLPAALLLAWLMITGSVPMTGPVVLGLALAAAASLGAAVVLCRRCLRRERDLAEALAQRDERDERLAAVVETLPLAVLSVDGNNIIQSCNAAGAQMFGYKPAELKGQPLQRLLPADLARRATDAKTDEQRTLGSAVGERKDGSRFPAALTFRKTRHGEHSLSVVVVNDLTEISHARHAAEAAGRAKHSLLRRVNHELRTPMGGILGAIDLLHDAGLSAAQAEHLDLIQQSAQALLCSFEQLIDHARLEAGQLELVRQPFSLRLAVEQALSPLEPLARAKGLRLELKAGPDLSDEYLGDPARLSQLIAILAGNAVKFTSRGEVTVSVSHTPEDDSLRFEVADTGEGIDPARIGRIFEPFEQGDGSQQRRHGGLGLGLSTASRLAQLMGGKIEAQSEPGRGSRFRFCLALERTSAPPMPSSVLVVLSNQEERRAAVRHLAEWGVAASGVPTGRQALTELLRSVVEGRPFALVLIEEHLPDLSAREVLARLRQRSEVTPPAVLLGRTETDLPLPEGVRAVLRRRPSGQQLYQAVLRAYSPR